jgi:RNA polymerase sigma-70 factor (ECF subfamily)
MGGTAVGTVRTPTKCSDIEHTVALAYCLPCQRVNGLGTVAAVLTRGDSSADEVLLRSIAAGDRQALAALYDRFAPSMLGLARRLLDSPSEAELVVHDVFLEAWHRARYYDPSRGNVCSWLMLRVRSRALDRRREAQGDRDRGPRELRSQGSSAIRDAALSADSTRVRALMETLPPDQRAVLELAYFEGCTFAAIANRLDLPIGVVRSSMVHAISRLRAAMRNHAGSES